MLSGATKSNEASYTRTDTPQGAEFTVTPAAKVNLLAEAGMFGCTVQFLPFIVGGLLIASGLSNGGGGGGALLLGLVVVGGYVALKALRPKAKDDRAPQKIIVSADGITAKGQHFAKAQIADLRLGHPGDLGVQRVEQWFDTSTSTGANLRDTANARLEQARRTLTIMARLKSSSEPIVLVERLTPYPGRDLLQDILEAMK